MDAMASKGKKRMRDNKKMAMILLEVLQVFVDIEWMVRKSLLKVKLKKTRGSLKPRVFFTKTD